MSKPASKTRSMPSSSPEGSVPSKLAASVSEWDRRVLDGMNARSREINEELRRTGALKGLPGPLPEPSSHWPRVLPPAKKTSS